MTWTIWSGTDHIMGLIRNGFFKDIGNKNGKTGKILSPGKFRTTVTSDHIKPFQSFLSIMTSLTPILFRLLFRFLIAPWHTPDMKKKDIFSFMIQITGQITSGQKVTLPVSFSFSDCFAKRSFG